jgi:hypothetical protein
MPVEAYIPLNAFQKYSLPSNAVPAIAYEDQDTQTILRYNNDSLFTYFDTGTGAPATFMSLFNTNTNSWSPANVQGEGVDLFQYWGSEASVSLPEIGLSFSFGGNPIFPAPEAHPGLVTFNASTPSWSNYTAVPAGSSGVQPPLVAESEIVYVPYGKAGVLLMMGGYSVSHLQPLSR